MAEAELARFIDRFTAEYVRVYPHPIERVWRAITEPAELGAWFMPGAVEPRAGGGFVFGGGWKGEVLAYEPPRLLRLRTADFGDGYFEYELSQAGAGTRMRFVQHFDPDLAYGEARDDVPGSGTPWPGAAGGWHAFWDALADHLDGVPITSRLPPTEFSELVALWLTKQDENDLALTPRQLAGIAAGLRRREHERELNGLYEGHMRATLPPR